MMSGPDPMSPLADSYYMPYDDQPYYGLPYSDPWYQFSIDELIRQGAQTAQVIGAGYPPGSNVVYAPQYPAGPASPQTVPQLPMPPAVGQGSPGQTSGGVQLSTTTLMLLVGGFLLFTLGKRGR